MRDKESLILRHHYLLGIRERHCRELGIGVNLLLRNDIFLETELSERLRCECMSDAMHCGVGDLQLAVLWRRKMKNGEITRKKEKDEGIACESLRIRRGRTDRATDFVVVEMPTEPLP